MNIRAINSSDMEQMKQIHEKYYKHEFDLPDFLNGFLYAFATIEDENIISIGGVKPIAESIIVTNKDVSAKVRREALYKMMEASVFVTKNAGFNQLHAFIQDEIWLKHLHKVGFNSCKGQAVYLNV